METCDLCHEEGPTFPWRHERLCREHLDYAMYYDRLSPEERVEEARSIEQYVAESEGL